MVKYFLNKARWLPLMLLFAGLMLVSEKAAAQCGIQGPTTACQDENITFSAPAGATNCNWDFGNSKTSTQCNGTTFYPNAGTYTVKLTTTLSSGQPCTTQVQVTVKPKPTLKLNMSSPKTQCYKNNKFCFTDSSEGGAGSAIVKIKYVFSDGQVFEFDSPGPKTTFCFSYNGGTPTTAKISLVYQLTDANGCVNEGTWSDTLTIRGNLGLNFTSNAPIGCDSTTATFVNNSLVSLSDIATWVWDYGDGQKDTNKFWKPAPQHKYRSHGVFNGSLTVTSKDGCTDVFTFNAAATNVVIKPQIVPNIDSTCLASPTINFTVIGVPPLTFTPDSIIWDFGDPPTGIKNRDIQKYATSHDFSGLGPYYVKVTVKKSPCRITVTDTVWIIGPQSKIEDPMQGIIIPAQQRYQCVITDSVHFTNVSKFYHNDGNYADDDAAAPVRNRDHAIRVWDFGDQYAPRCTTWTAMGQNVGINCRYSRDSLPVHWYTPWDTILVDSFINKSRPMTTTIFNDVTQTCNVVQLYYNDDSLLYKKLFYQNIVQCYTVRLWHKDTVRPAPHDCEHSDNVSLALGPPKATGLSYIGIKCYAPPSPPYGVTFRLSQTKPGCSQEWVAFNFDSLSNPTTFIPQTGLFPPPLPGPMPWPPTPPYPNSFVKPYSAGEIADRKKGWATVGLVIGQGLQQAQLKGNPALACYDTVWYHNFLRYIFMDARFEVFKPAKAEKKICRYDTVFVAVTNPVQDGTALIQWNWGDGYNHLEFPQRFKPHPTIPGKLINYILTYDIYTDPNAAMPDTTAHDSIITAIIHTWDTVPDISRAQEALAAAFKSLNLDINEIPPTEISKYFMNADGTTGCIDTTGYGSLITYDVVADSIDILNRRDTMIADTLWHQYTLEHFHDEGHPMYNVGRFFVTHTLVNTDGCQQFRTQEVHVGYYQELYPMINGMVDSVTCKGTPITFVDSLRYFAWNDINNVLDPTAYWRDNNRIAAGKETIKWDMDTVDKTSQFNINGPLYTHLYTLPGKYVMAMATKDSTGCRDTVYKRIYVTGVKAGFMPTLPRPNCVSILTFSDTSKVSDPCFPTLGYNCDSIIFREWDFGDGSPVSPGPSNLKFVGHRYTSKDTFYVKLKVKTLLGCEDSAVFQLILRGPKPRFSSITDTVICKGETVTFINESREITPTSEWNWDFGDQQTYFTKSDTSVTHQYNTAGEFQVYLRMSDFLPDTALFCTISYPDTAGKVPPPLFVVRVLDRAPAVAIASDDTICPGGTVTFNSAQSDPKYTSFMWSLGDGDTITTGQPQITHQYNNPGSYEVILVPDYTAGPNDPLCPDRDTVRVTVVDINADFDIDSTNMPEAKFTNKSSGASSYEWYFTSPKGEDSLTNFIVQSTSVNPAFNYVDNLGDYFVCLIAKNETGCADTTCKIISNRFNSSITPYNVFTPDGDGKNDVFDIDIKGETKYQLTVFNRWGEKVFESDNSQTDWNGKTFNSGAQCPAGTYYYVLKYQLKGREEKELKGTVNLILKQ